MLGVACGSLGALTAVTADRLEAALDRVAAGDWTERELPALVAEADGERLEALNDLVLVRDGAGQVAVEISVDGEFTSPRGRRPRGRDAAGLLGVHLAAGGPLVLPAAAAFALTPLSPHGGVCPPLVVTAGTRVSILFDAGNGGARVEVDGQVIRRAGAVGAARARARLARGRAAVLVALGDQEPLLAALRRRRILIDSPRVLARDDREAAAPERRRQDAPW